MEENESEPICLNCHQSICATNFASHSAFCERNIKICKMCNEPIRIVNEKEHFEQSHVTITCDDCGIPLEKWMLLKHQEICSKRMVTCEFCEADFRFDEHSAHLEFCSSKTEKCMICKKYVMLKDKQKHSELHLLPKKLANDEVKQNIINEAISLQGVSESCNKKEKNENTNQSSLSSARVMASQSDVYINSQSLGAEGSKHYGQCPICKGTIPWIDMNVHIPNCADKTGKCSRCGEDVPDSEIKDHILKTCKKIGSKSNSRFGLNYDTNDATSPPGEMCKCPYCRQPCSSDRISEHIKNCSDSYFACPMCSEYVIEKDRDKHVSMQCRALFDYGPESFYDYTASSNAAENKSEKSVNHFKERNKNPGIKPHKVSCSLCHEEYFADFEENHLKYCTELIKKNDYSASSNAYENKSKNSERQPKKNNYPVINKIKCCFCDEEYEADSEEFHLKNCTELNEKNVKSYAGAAKLNLKNTSFSSYSKEQKEISSKYCTCIKCNDTIRKERMQNHLLICKKNEKSPCTYCDEAISVVEEELHLKVCKGLIASKNSIQGLANKNDSKGVIPKNSKFAQMVKVSTAKCSHCEVTFNADILLYHEEQCVHKLIPCDKCCKNVKMIDLETHVCKSDKGKKGKRGGKMNKDEKSETGTNFGFKSLKNLFGLNSPEKKIDSGEARNQPRYPFTYEDTTYSYRNSYSYSDRSTFDYYPNMTDNEYNHSYQEEEPRIPCEFCGEPFKASDIILHSTGCDPESVKYRKPAEFEDTKENKSYSNFPCTDVQKFFSVERKDKKFSSIRLENRKHTESTIAPGEFLQNTYNMNMASQELQPTKPDIVKESENLSNRSKFQSVWNTDSDEIDSEAVEIFPRDSPPMEMTIDKVVDKIEVSDATEKMLVDNFEEVDNEIFDMIDFITNGDGRDASGENNSDSAEDGYLQSEKLSSGLEKNEVPLVASRQYENVYELLEKSKNVKANKSEEGHQLSYAADCSVRQKHFDQKFEMPHYSLQEIYKDRSQNPHQTDRNYEKYKDDVSKWQKWRSSNSDS